MKNSLLILTLCWSCAYLSASAQNTASCNANFEFTVTGHSVQFTSAINSIPRLQHWEFGDGTFSNDLNPVHVYTNPGTYRVLHRVYDSLKTCFDTASKLVTILQTNVCNIEAAFSFYHDSLNCRKIHFINQSVPLSSAMHFVWKFGDSTTSNDINPTHEYAKAGSYNVCLVIEEGPDCRKELCKTLEISCEACTFEPKFEWKINTGHPNEVYFHNLTITPSADAKFSWSFGDGTSSSESNPTHTYEHAGEYQVCLTIEISNLCHKTTCEHITIKVPECNVHARFEWKHDPQQWNKIWLANVTEPVAQIWRTYWSYGDGSSSQDFNSFHTYDKSGKYYVCLKVISLNGCISYYCDSVMVTPPVSACDTLHVKFAYHRNTERPNVISFEAVSNEPLVKQRWVIRRDSLVNGYPWQIVLETNDPTFIFPMGGWYNVCLYATTHDNCVREYCEKVQIERVVADSGHREIPVSVYPNPSRSSVNLMLNLDSRTPISVTVLSAEGIIRQQIQVAGQAGNNTITIPVDKLSQGQYLVQLRYAGQVRWARFQKL